MNDLITIKFNHSYKVDPATECWNWAGVIDNHGYGHLRSGNLRYKAHRYAYELHVGPIPQGLQIDHLCRNRKCVNPVHLEPVTQAENMRRGNGIGAQKHRRLEKERACPKGHPISAYATWKGNRRECGECNRIRVRLINRLQATAKANQRASVAPRLSAEALAELAIAAKRIGEHAASVLSIRKVERVAA